MLKYSSRFATLSEWLSWLETLHPTEIELGLQRIFRVAKKLGLYSSSDSVRASGVAINQNKNLPKIITVAGTNGKGSCIKAQEEIYLQKQLSVGCFTSPHVLSYNERIRVNGKDLTDQQICNIFHSIDEARGSETLTYFEFGALAAMVAFHQGNCEFWLLEVGLGGRLDAVNIIDSTVAIVTSIGFDHEKWLGNTLEKIAYEKAGVLRKDSVAVLASQNMPRSIDSYANELNSTLLKPEQDWFLKKVAFRDKSNCFSLTLPSKRTLPIDNPMLPIESISAAFVVADQFNIEFSSDECKKIIQRCVLQGRFEQRLCRELNVIFDVAHNPMATERLAQNLKKYKRVHGIDSVDCVLGMMNDKKIPQSLEPLMPHINHWHVCAIPSVDRAATCDELTSACLNAGIEKAKIFSYDNVEEGIRKIFRQQGLDKSKSTKSTLLVCGSFYTVCDAKKALQNMGE